ncbi:MULTISPECIES: hypothetical protein [unclassified Methylibium]|uniref:hypothetical protein n=1 Tax=unclassified Methylibium TaxID=2633235 RepID=UPI0003F4132F|nr:MULTISPECIES: hypothetical protein [unclassified Methylibium]EWS54823.1 hypothetical protein X551_02379 [Methylibium sp. T29]EWS61508.1 hypothetical protein Y694_00782 [Methylibium sp. T29-B]
MLTTHFGAEASTMNFLTRNAWAKCFAAYYQALTDEPCLRAVLLERGRALYDEHAHHHPVSTAAAERRTDLQHRLSDRMAMH